MKTEERLPGEWTESIGSEAGGAMDEGDKREHGGYENAIMKLIPLYPIFKY